jgi:hypothetical protein
MRVIKKHVKKKIGNRKLENDIFENLNIPAYLKERKDLIRFFFRRFGTVKKLEANFGNSNFVKSLIRTKINMQSTKETENSKFIYDVSCIEKASPRILTMYQKSIVEKLIKSHGDNIIEMINDIELNVRQQSEGQSCALLHVYFFWKD